MLRYAVVAGLTIAVSEGAVSLASTVLGPKDANLSWVFLNGAALPYCHQGSVSLVGGRLVSAWQVRVGGERGPLPTLTSAAGCHYGTTTAHH